jgi:hypothetical protein
MTVPGVGEVQQTEDDNGLREEEMHQADLVLERDFTGQNDHWNATREAREITERFLAVSTKDEGNVHYQFSFIPDLKKPAEVFVRLEGEVGRVASAVLFTLRM